jgi:inosine-uridine nucleoside N-ribohydrolase
MDGGIDDALALILALRSPELEVAGITAVSGNVSVEQAALNALRVLEVLDRKEVWVAKGLANPLIRDPIRATSFHGKDGLGDSNLPIPKLRPDTRNALDLIPGELETTGSHRLTIIATGPLTNIAALLTKEPSIARRVDELVIMGGAYGLTEYGIGNETPVAEFNIYSDPEAAKIVFESGIALKAVGLDVTMAPEAQLTPSDYSRIRSGKTQASQFASRILAKAMRRWKRFALHDPMAVATRVKPSFFRFHAVPVAVETRGEKTTGMTVTDRRDWLPRLTVFGQKVRVCKEVKARAFKQLVLNSLLRA